jgi:excinuclease ABC subunit C
MNRNVFAFITSVQDEVHRFAITYQRQKAKKKTFSSSLTKIPRVGDATAKALLGHFKTVGAIAEASAEELAAVKGVSRTAAAAVYAHFHSED